MRKRILTEDDLANIDINQFEAIDKGNHSFDTLRESGVYRLWNSSTSPCGTTNDYILSVYKYNSNIVQMAHSATSNNTIKDRVYVRSYIAGQWSRWRELTNVELETEIDHLKQSGVESNQILVDALNSKGVSASTSSTIKTNVSKVTNIKVGDYNKGDYIPYSSLDLSLTNNGLPVTIFKKDISGPTAIRMTDNYIYVGTDGGRLHKWTHSGSQIWEKRVSNGSITSINSDGDSTIYVGDSMGIIRRINSNGSTNWSEWVNEGNSVSKILLQGNSVYGVEYSSRPGSITKFAVSTGNKEWVWRANSVVVGGSPRLVDADTDGDNIFATIGWSRDTSGGLVWEGRVVVLNLSGKHTQIIGDIYMKGSSWHIGCIQRNKAIVSTDRDIAILEDGKLDVVGQRSQNVSPIKNMVPDQNGNFLYGISGNYVVKVSRWGGIVWRVWQGSNLRDVDYNSNFVVAAQDDFVELFSSFSMYGAYLK